MKLPRDRKVFDKSGKNRLCFKNNHVCITVYSSTTIIIKFNLFQRLTGRLTIKGEPNDWLKTTVDVLLRVHCAKKQK